MVGLPSDFLNLPKRTSFAMRLIVLAVVTLLPAPAALSQVAGGCSPVISAA
jgi:hypothetical protein